MKRLAIGDVLFVNRSKIQELLDGEYFGSPIDVYDMQYSWYKDGELVSPPSWCTSICFDEVGVHDIELRAWLPDLPISVFAERVEIYSPVPIIMGVETPLLRASTPYTLQLNIELYTGRGPFNWEMMDSVPGLTIDSTTGLISGTPTTSGWFNPQVTVYDAAGKSARVKYKWYVLA